MQRAKLSKPTLFVFYLAKNKKIKIDILAIIATKVVTIVGIAS